LRTNISATLLLVIGNTDFSGPRELQQLFGYGSSD
jgi:hypothetical protein